MHEVSIIEGENSESSYLQVNPLGQVPTVKHGSNVVMGGYAAYLNYLAKSFPKIKKQLYPEQFATEIDSHILWYSCMFKPVSQKY
mmetsp:Transcript_13192/g.20553  ORF Transcript_13192/g.20553 Transcript_13192/m.20553 type:complete len:85 (+) Transcript_13192:173-427(+)|eukprot:CAMPEP_0170481646 /NCGR_PEP_ID=MMETSP0208-20121228/2016_1 /TAXON_ID=197538 /ORGANISM="Strombidium inclinatum, Strain S3" /LENGTH=84 /DNA_ID=CAMNT_0010754393 /DNA_START=169 /DNA_END=423 /DNA_ORIENTATION=-